MKQVYVHGLGQTPASWDEVLEALGMASSAVCPHLGKLIQHQEVSYDNLYRAFVDFCDGLREPVDLCGLSLGGVLALHYAVEHPEKIRSLALIAAPYKMPKRLLRLQNAVFRLMPEKAFGQMGLGKWDFIRLCRSMMDLDFTPVLEKISCPTAVICGKKDGANRKVCKELSTKLRNSQLFFVDGAGHEVNTQAPEKLAEILAQFCFRGSLQSVH